MIERLRPWFPLVAVLFAVPLASQVLVRDIDPTTPPTSAGSFASDFAPLGARYLFSANHPSGKQIFITDGTPAGTQLVTQESPRTSFLQPQLTDGAELNGVRYFRCSSSPSGLEVWRTDGTRAGTHLFVDLVPGGPSSSPRYFAAAGGLVYFSAAAPAFGEELWVTDGTVGGTRCLDLVPGPGDSRPFWIRRFGNRVVLRADGEPWISDGTPAGTVQLADIEPGRAGSYPSDFVEFNGRSWFWAGGPAIGYELWVTDGTPAGTAAFADVRPGSQGSYPRDLVAAGGALYFTADDGVHGREPWRTDGTAAGTLLVSDLEPGVTGSDPSELAALGGRVLFSAATSSGGREPWISDGSTAGTFQLADLVVGGADSDPSAFTAIPAAGFAVFRAFTPGTGWEMFRTDGTRGGTGLAVDFQPGPGDGLDTRNNWEFGVIGTRVVLGPDDGLHGDEPWVSDGTAAGSRMLLDVYPSANGSAPSDVVQWGDRCLFLADDGVHGRELWVTDGTPAGTQLVVDLSPASSGAFGPFIRFGDQLLFAGSDDLTHGLFRTDGTAAGTTIAVPLPGSSPFFFTQVAVSNDRLVIVRGSDLYASDGSAAGTVLLRSFPFRFPFGVAPHGLTAFAGRVFFVAEVNQDIELWVTDGTAAGTRQFVDLDPLRSSGPRSLTVAGGSLFFEAGLDATGRELWATDGTVAGTRLVRDLAPGTASGAPRDLIDVDGRLFFTASSGYDRELWISDGTAVGTRLVRNITSSGSSDIRGMTALGSRLLFHVDLPGTGREPWISDGTSAGTRAILDLFPGPSGSIPARGSSEQAPFAVVGSGRVALFAAEDGVFGTELWRTDGTPAGTYRLSDIASELLSSDPAAFGRWGSTVLFAATDLDHGRELWAMDVLDTGDSLAAAYGRGCDGSNGRPELTGVGAPFVGNPGFALSVARGRANSSGALLLNATARERALPGGGGCLIYPVVPAVGVPFATGATGSAVLALAIPTTAALRGVELFAQGFVLDPGGAWVNTWALTNPVHLMIGD